MRGLVAFFFTTVCAAAEMPQPLSDAAELDRLEAKIGNDREFVKALKAKIESAAEPVAMKAAALSRYFRLRNDDNAELCAKLLRDPTTHTDLLDKCVSELLRIQRLKTGNLKGAFAELRGQFAGHAAPFAAIERAAERVEKAMDLSLASGRPQNTPDVARLDENMRASEIHAAKLRENGKELSVNLLKETSSLLDSKNWVAANKKLKEWFAAFSELDQAPACEVLIELVMAENGGEVLSEKSAADYLTFIGENVKKEESAERCGYYLCEALYKEGKYDSLLSALKSFRAAHPNSKRAAQADLLEGNALALLGNGQKAQTIFNRLASDPNSTPETVEKAIFLTGWTHLFAQNSAAARASFEELLKQFPNGEYATKAREILAREK